MNDQKKLDIFDETKIAKKEIKEEELAETEKRVEFGKRLRKLREENEFKQTDLADVLKRTHDIISNYERGVRYPYKQELEKICELFNVTLDYFFPDHQYPELKDISSKKNYPKNVKRRNSPVVVKRAEDMGIKVAPVKKMYSTSTRTPLPDELGIDYDVEEELKEFEDIENEADATSMEHETVTSNTKPKPAIEVIQSDLNDKMKRKITITIGKEISINVEEY
jgi:repressor LexA